MQPDPLQTEMPGGKSLWDTETFLSLQQGPISGSKEERLPTDDHEHGLQSSKNGKAMCLKDKKRFTTEHTENTEAPKRGKSGNNAVFSPRFIISVFSVCSAVEKN